MRANFRFCRSLGLDRLENLATTIHQPKEKTMKTLKRLGAAIALTFALAFAAFADCPIPGETQGPPCFDAQITPGDPVDSAEPSESSSVIEISVTTLDVLQTAL